MSPEANRARVKAWYNANPDRVIARAAAWAKAHQERRRTYQREWKRRHHPRPSCQTVGCGRPIELGQRKFCLRCRDFYEQEVWHTYKLRRAA